MGTQQQHTATIKILARQLGFDHCGIAKAEALEEDARRLEKWLAKGMHGGMAYMENHFDLRTDPRKLVPGARSVITLLLNYFPEKEQNPSAPQISKYAYGKDYHEVIRAKLKDLLAMIRERVGEINGRGFVDSAPVLERSWAQKSGLGWIGKNGNLITRSGGSFFFIATLITDIDLEPDDPFARDYCGTCNKCVESCPTEAILPDKTINGSQCISYFTIELKDQLIPEEMKGKFDNWMFGCDTCQDVCPWNRFSTPTLEGAFHPLPAVLNFTSAEWEALSEDAFKNIFRDSPLKRAKWEGVRRNLRFLKG
ncbi:MAG: tRNA epoxyqueuosine(34) reductase QueG [Chitinophagaceae bacterium]|nr:tRNA epoxyqueuosine(34) reductase QueG [Chitinophagaceae bacterium]